MAESDESIEGRPPDPFVAARIHDPGAPAPASFQLAGLLGDSDRDGFRRLYLNTSLDYYVEFRTTDVLAVETVAPETPPFVGLDATRVTLTRDAAVEYVRSRAASGGADAFAVDVRGGGLPEGLTPDPTGTLPTDFTLPESFGVGCVPDTLPPACEFRTFNTCNTCGLQCLTRNATCLATRCATCFGGTCQTCDDATCRTCGQATCQTCDQATCQTCNQVTCVTCNLQATCHTCLGGQCWKTVFGATCRTCQLSACNWNCQSIATPCITEFRCPTLVCP